MLLTEGLCKEHGKVEDKLNLISKFKAAVVGESGIQSLVLSWV